MEAPPSRQWTAAYLDGRSPVRRPATVRIMATGLEISLDGGGTLWWPLAEVRQTQGFYAGEQVRLERGAVPEVVVIDDLAFVTALARASPRRSARLHDPARRGLRLRLTVLAALGAIGAAAALYAWGIPALAGVVAGRVPVAWEERLGESVVSHVAPPDRRCGDAERLRILDGLLAEVTAALPRRDYRFRLLVVDAEGVNAFALPGGRIVLLRGLIERTGSAEELAGVLAHEVQHIVHRHTTQALLRHASTGLLVAATVGDVSGMMAFGLESARALSALSYSRRAEEEADLEGMRLLLAARIDPGGMVSFFETIGGRERGAGRSAFGYLSTHPATDDRLARLEALARSAPPETRRLLPDYAWRDIDRVCG